jgi:3-oxoacyl-[acyl-carrier-protein] synthase II
MRDRADSQRVVITGMGLVTPIGIGREEAWASAVAGRSGAGPITRFDTSDMHVRIACEVTDFVPEDFMDRRAVRRNDRFTQMAVAAGHLALADAHLTLDGDGRRAGAVVASGVGGAETRESSHERMLREGPDRVPPMTVPATVANMAAAQLSMTFGLRGPVWCQHVACAAGTQAIGDAAEILRRGDADVMLAGGAEACLTRFWVAGFDAMRVLSRRNDDPDRAARPFDVGRDGFLLGEAACILVLEPLDRARERGAPIVAEIAGYGLTSDAHHITDPDPDGDGLAAAITEALRNAGVEAAEVGYVSAHGGASRPGDPAEVLAIRTGLGAEAAARVPVSTTKPIHGHSLTATGAVEAALTALAVLDQRLPPTANLQEVDPACNGVDHVVGAARPAAVATALSLSSGLGGHNAVLAISRPPDHA